ncbi:MAG: 50S ribosomal protein L15 [Chloroflexota bacterium]|nr:MAG: 50S ribosomal protein L15 [Chloroflexota bacterium]
MKLHEMEAGEGARHRRKRIGRGNSSGHGTTAGRGTKGQKARAGGNVPPRFEGGQLPLVRRLPYKRGFVNHFRVEYAVINVGALQRFPAGTEVSPEMLHTNGLIESVSMPVKILGDGALDRALSVRAHRFSATARGKIEAAGGKVEEIGNAASSS